MSEYLDYNGLKRYTNKIKAKLNASTSGSGGSGANYFPHPIKIDHQYIAYSESIRLAPDGNSIVYLNADRTALILIDEDNVEHELPFGEGISASNLYKFGYNGVVAWTKYNNDAYIWDINFPENDPLVVSVIGYEPVSGSDTTNGANPNYIYLHASSSDNKMLQVNIKDGSKREITLPTLPSNSRYLTNCFTCPNGCLYLRVRIYSGKLTFYSIFYNESSGSFETSVLYEADTVYSDSNFTGAGTGANVAINCGDENSIFIYIRYTNFGMAYYLNPETHAIEKIIQVPRTNTLIFSGPDYDAPLYNDVVYDTLYPSDYSASPAIRLDTTLSYPNLQYKSVSHALTLVSDHITKSSPLWTMRNGTQFAISPTQTDNYVTYGSLIRGHYEHIEVIKDA